MKLLYRLHLKYKQQPNLIVMEVSMFRNKLNMKEIEKELAEDMHAMQRAIIRELKEKEGELMRMANEGPRRDFSGSDVQTPPPYSPEAPREPEKPSAPPLQEQEDSKSKTGILTAFKRRLSQVFSCSSDLEQTRVKPS